MKAAPDQNATMFSIITIQIKLLDCIKTKMVDQQGVGRETGYARPRPFTSNPRRGANLGVVFSTSHQDISRLGVVVGTSRGLGVGWSL